MKSNRYGRSMAGQVVLGLMVVALGVLFMLDTFNVLHFQRVVSFWPSVLLVLGVVKLLDTRSSNGAMVGTLLIAAGALLILNNLGLLYFQWRMVWPALLILFGGSVIYRALTRRAAVQGEVKSDDDSFVEATAIVGSFQRRLTTPNFQGGEITAIMGGCNLDLRDCSIQGEVVINVFAAMGGIVIKCPPDWTVVLQGAPFMGGFEEKTVRPPDGSKRLVVKGYAIMGGVDVRY